MDIKFAHIWTALAKLRDEVGSDYAMANLVIQTSVAEDNPGEGKMIECLTVKCEVIKKPGTYDTFSSDIGVTYVLEVFADNEKRVPRLTVTSSRDLEKKE